MEKRGDTRRTGKGGEPGQTGGGGLGGGRVKGLGRIRERRNKAESKGGDRERESQGGKDTKKEERKR